MKTAKELREDREILASEAEAIENLVTSEKREPNSEENTRLAQIFGRGKESDKDFLAGEINLLNKKIEQRERIETEMATRAVERANTQAQAFSRHTSIVPGAGPIDRQRHGTVKGFQNREEAFRSGCWFAAKFLGHAKAEQYCRDMGIQAALAGNVGSSGGFLVPEEMERAIIRLVETYGVFRQNVRVVPMSSDTLLVPRRTAGSTAYYVQEVPTSITESTPTAGQAQLVAKVLAVRSLVSRDLLEDAIIDIINWITTEIALAFAIAEDQAGFIGDGTSTYGGITGVKNALLAGSEYTAATGNTAFGTLDLEDFEGMLGKLPTYALPTAKWYISQAGYWTSMARLKYAAGGNNVTTINGAPMMEFMGLPVVISQVMNSTTTAQTSTEGLAFVGALEMAATMGNRRGIETQVLRELYAATRQVGIITSQRYDINVHETGTATVAGPLVQLNTPGS